MNMSKHNKCIETVNVNLEYQFFRAYTFKSLCFQCNLITVEAALLERHFLNQLVIIIYKLCELSKLDATIHS